MPSLPTASIVRVRTAPQLAALYAALALADREQLIAVGLDAQHAVVASVRKPGTEQGVACRPAELLGPLLAAGCVAVALVHNHPSGHAWPSVADRAFTARMAQACAVLGVRLVDHVIVAAGGWYSFERAGLLQEPAQWP